MLSVGPRVKRGPCSQGAPRQGQTDPQTGPSSAVKQVHEEGVCVGFAISACRRFRVGPGRGWGLTEGQGE